MTEVMQQNGIYYQEIHPFVDTGWIKFHRSLVTQVIPNITSLATLKVMMLFLEQTTDRRDRDVTAELSIRLIARLMNLSPTSAEKAVKELIAMGIVRVTRPGDRVTATEYELNRSFVLLEEVNVISEGVPEVVTPDLMGVPEVVTPNGQNDAEVYQKLVQSLEEDSNNKTTPPRARDASIPQTAATPSPVIPLAPLASTEDEFYAAARAFDEAARVARLARMSPDARRRAEALEQMVATLAEVTDTTVKANRSRLESVAAKIDEFTPEQVRRGFGDPQGWWWQEWYKGRERRQKPTLYDIQEYVKRAAEWTPSPVAGGARSAGGPATAGDGIDAAWAAVLRAIRRTADNRVVMNGLDEPARAGVRAAGNLSTLRNMRPGVDDRTIRARFAAGYREALDRAVVATSGATRQPASAAAD